MNYLRNKYKAALLGGFSQLPGKIDFVIDGIPQIPISSEIWNLNQSWSYYKNLQFTTNGYIDIYNYNSSSTPQNQLIYFDKLIKKGSKINIECRLDSTISVSGRQASIRVVFFKQLKETQYLNQTQFYANRISLIEGVYGSPQSIARHLVTFDVPHEINEDIYIGIIPMTWSGITLCRIFNMWVE